jgi:hypothetical protein
LSSSGVSSRTSTTREKAITGYENTRHGQFRLKRQPLDAFLEQNYVGTVNDVIEGIGKLAAKGITHLNILHVGEEEPDAAVCRRGDAENHSARVACQQKLGETASNDIRNAPL